MRGILRFAKTCWLGGALGVVSAVAAPGAAPDAGARVVLVGIDGASWNVLDPLLERGELPALADLARRGVTAQLEAVEPVNSPAVWTSIATGRLPRHHGVTDFQATRLAIRAPTVFERMSASGLRVGLYDYLVTWPPRRLPGGFVIPGWLRYDERVTPSDVWERAGVPAYVYDVGDARAPDEMLALARSEVREKGARWLALQDAFDLDVGAVSFYAVDLTSHRFWHAAFPASFGRRAPPASPDERSAIADALRGVDRSLGVIAGSLGPEDSLLVVSDHGFRPDRKLAPIWVARLEAALDRSGLDPERDAFRVVTCFGIVILQVHEGPFEEREAVLRRLVALLSRARGPGGDRLFDVDVIDVAPRPPGARRSWWQRTRQSALKWVTEHVYHLNTDRPGHAYVFARPRSRTLERLWPDAHVELAGRSVPVTGVFDRDRFSGEHARMGVFLAAGGPIAPSRERARLSAIDVAPLLLHLAGMPIPDDLEGRLPVELLAPAHLARNPPRHVPASRLPGLPPEIASGARGAPSPELVERLRALGYLR